MVSHSWGTSAMVYRCNQLCVTTTNANNWNGCLVGWSITLTQRFEDVMTKHFILGGIMYYSVANFLVRLHMHDFKKNIYVHRYFRTKTFYTVDIRYYDSVWVRRKDRSQLVIITNAIKFRLTHTLSLTHIYIYTHPHTQTLSSTHELPTFLS